MRSLLTLTLATATSAFVLPDSLNIFNDFKDDLKETLEDIPKRLRKSLDEATDKLSTEISSAIHNKLQDEDVFVHDFVDKDAPSSDEPISIFGRTGGDFTDHTTYELIAKSNYTKKFFKLVKEHESFGKLLNSTDKNYTLFVPIDEAFEHIPHDDKHKPSDEFVQDVLNYHLGIGEYPASRILFTHTVPTTLKEKLLGDKPQRLRTSVGFSGVRVNLYSKVIAVNFVSILMYLGMLYPRLTIPRKLRMASSTLSTEFSSLLPTSAKKSAFSPPNSQHCFSPMIRPSLSSTSTTSL